MAANTFADFWKASDIESPSSTPVSPQQVLAALTRPPRCSMSATPLDPYNHQNYNQPISRGRSRNGDYTDKSSSMPASQRPLAKDETIKSGYATVGHPESLHRHSVSSQPQSDPRYRSPRPSSSQQQQHQHHQQRQLYSPAQPRSRLSSAVRSRPTNEADLLHDLLEKAARLEEISARNHDEISCLKSKITQNDNRLDQLESQIGLRQSQNFDINEPQQSRSNENHGVHDLPIALATTASPINISSEELHDLAQYNFGIDDRYGSGSQNSGVGSATLPSRSLASDSIAVHQDGKHSTLSDGLGLVDVDMASNLARLTVLTTSPAVAVDGAVDVVVVGDVVVDVEVDVAGVGAGVDSNLNASSGDMMMMGVGTNNMVMNTNTNMNTNMNMNTNTNMNTNMNTHLGVTTDPIPHSTDPDVLHQVQGHAQTTERGVVHVTSDHTTEDYENTNVLDVVV